MWVEVENHQPGTAAVGAAAAGIAVTAGALAGSVGEVFSIVAGSVVAIVTWAVLNAKAREHRRAMVAPRAPVHPFFEAGGVAEEVPAGEEAVAEVLRLRDQLGASLAEVEALEAKARRAESRSADAARLLLDVGRFALPELRSVSEQWRAALDRGEPGLDRRGEAGALLAALRRVETLLADLLALGESEVPSAAHRPVPTNLTDVLRQACGKAVDVAIDPSLPVLFSCDKPTLEVLIAGLLEHARRRGSRHLAIEARGEPCAGSLWTVRFAVTGILDVPHADLALLGSTEPSLALQEYGDRSHGLTLALAARSLRRLGGRVVKHESGAESGAIVVEVVLAPALERRAVEVKPQIEEQDARELAPC